MKENIFGYTVDFRTHFHRYTEELLFCIHCVQPLMSQMNTLSYRILHSM